MIPLNRPNICSIKSIYDIYSLDMDTDTTNMDSITDSTEPDNNMLDSTLNTYNDFILKQKIVYGDIYDNIKLLVFSIITFIVCLFLIFELYNYYEQKKEFERFTLPLSVVQTAPETKHTTITKTTKLLPSCNKLDTLDTLEKGQALRFRNWENRQKYIINYTYEPIPIDNDISITINATLESKV
jgi:hypothetical protein